MINLSKNNLLMIEPRSTNKEPEVNDVLTNKMERLLRSANTTGPFYKGFHTCICGERSSNSDLKVGKYTTNSLAAHYLRCHRSEVPQSELEKVKNL